MTYQLKSFSKSCCPSPCFCQICLQFFPTRIALMEIIQSESSLPHPSRYFISGMNIPPFTTLLTEETRSKLRAHIVAKAPIMGMKIGLSKSDKYVMGVDVVG